MGKLDNIAPFYPASGYENFDLFYQKSEIYYNKSTENTIVLEDDTTSDDDDNIDRPIPKKIWINCIWSSLTRIPHNPSTSESTGNDKNNPLPAPTYFLLDGHETPNSQNIVIVKEE